MKPEVINSMCPTNQMLHKQLPCALRYIDSSRLSEKAPGIFIMLSAIHVICFSNQAGHARYTKAPILLSAYTTVVWLYEPTASIPLCGEKEIEDIIPVRKQSAQKQVKFVSLHKASLKKVFISSSSQK